MDGWETMHRSFPGEKTYMGVKVGGLEMVECSDPRQRQIE